MTWVAARMTITLEREQTARKAPLAEVDPEVAAAIRQEEERQQHTLAPLEGGFDGVAETHADFFVNDQAVHYRFDSVPGLGIELDPDAIGQFDQFAIDARTDDPSVTASSFQSPQNKAAVLWLDGLEPLPDDYLTK